MLQERTILVVFVLASCGGSGLPPIFRDFGVADVSATAEAKGADRQAGEALDDAIDIVWFDESSDRAGDADAFDAAPAPPCLCMPGDVKCKYANTHVKTCVQDQTGGCHWSELELCPEGTLCKDGEGCGCEFNAGGWESCDGAGKLAEACAGKDLKTCEEWACGEDGCCFAAPRENCCQKSSDCADCIHTDTGEVIPCPGAKSGEGEIPGGFVLNLCTIDACMVGECYYSDKECDDGDDCTNDACDLVTGECVYEEKQTPICLLVPCWGETQDEADKKCNDDNACTLQECDYGADGFSPWLSPAWPVVDDPENLAEGVGVCEFTDVLEAGMCHDPDPCTIDSCDPKTGCTHDFDEANVLCTSCLTDADCEGLDEDPCTINKCYSQANLCYVTEIGAAHCNDSDPCTVDYCDPEAGTPGDPESYCVNDWALGPCQCANCFQNTDCLHPTCGVDPCSDTVCVKSDGAELGQCEYVAVQCTQCPGPECIGECSEGWCNLDTWECEFAYKDCDDGNPCTVDSCLWEWPGGCIHQPVYCPAPDLCHTASCDPDTGECVNTELECPSKPCKVGKCDPETGLCTYPLQDPTDSPDPCVYCLCDMAMQEVVCMPVTCDDNNACTNDWCDPDTGKCVYEMMDQYDGSPCWPG